MAKNIILIIALGIFSFIIYRTFFVNIPLQKANVNIKGQEYTLEIASTISQKSKGLMKRNSLCSNCGMIFVSEAPSEQIFWMKNTLIPLDIIFLDPDGKVINIESAVPQPSVPDLQLKLYRSTAPSQFVIELNSGEAKKLNLVPGDVINVPSGM
ncbi:DUF192 domain-containing protein [Candidatus Shapirobacteria bacterium]|nr:DUF192 domain-containing protein [Candidatus Shapirobacteria bacterium]